MECPKCENEMQTPQTDRTVILQAALSDVQGAVKPVTQPVEPATLKNQKNKKRKSVTAHYTFFNLGWRDSVMYKGALRYYILGVLEKMRF